MRNITKYFTKKQIENFAFLCAAALGILFRIKQYLANRSLWADEASLALNIVNRSFGELTLPLDYEQGAPVGFLFIEKINVNIFGNSEYVLRLFPLVAGLVSVLILCVVARKYFGIFGLIAILSFSISGEMIYYSSELKQYSTDVSVALWIIYVTSLCLKKNGGNKELTLLGITGAVSILLSHPSVFILAAAGLALFVDSFFKKDIAQMRRLILVGAVWLGVFLLAYFVSLRFLIANENLQNYWENSYAPVPPWKHLGWYKNIFVSLLPQAQATFIPGNLGLFIQKYLNEFLLASMVLGGISLARRDLKFALLLIVPIFLVFTASFLNKYPMSGRFLHFLVPLLLLLMAEGFMLMYFVISRLNKVVPFLLYLGVGLLVLWAPLNNAYDYYRRPFLGEDIKPVLRYIDEHQLTNDEIYVHIGSVTPVLYYLPFYGFETENIFFAQKSWNIKRFTVDVEDYQGTERIWFIFSHVISCDCDAIDRNGRIQAYLEVVDKHGIRLDNFQSSDAVTYLYDLNP